MVEASSYLPSESIGIFINNTNFRIKYKKEFGFSFYESPSSFLIQEVIA